MERSRDDGAKLEWALRRLPLSRRRFPVEATKFSHPDANAAKLLDSKYIVEQSSAFEILKSVLSLIGLLFFALGASPAAAKDNLLITEFMAVNNSTLADPTGGYPDWIEIYNAGSNTVNLGGWYLTDSALKLTKWQFPSTNL